VIVWTLILFKDGKKAIHLWNEVRLGLSALLYSVSQTHFQALVYREDCLGGRLCSELSLWSDFSQT
jgi:hypothetical protein